MGFIFGFLKRLIKCTLYFVIFAAIIVLIPNLPPYTKFTSIKLEPTLPLVGPLALNNALNNPEVLYKGKLLGPEAFHIYNGELYTSLATGEIVKISPGGHVTFVTKIGQPCASLTQEHICGRPLGFAINEKTNQLYIADAYHGIWKVDLKTDKKQLLVSPRVAIEGRLPMLFNSIALADNGDFYWTDSSSDFQLKDGAYSVLTDPSGRLFYYNAAKNESKVLLDDLWFANGVAISPDKQFVVASETSRFRIIKYYISGPKKGKSEVFAAGLPGTPDNIQVLPDGSGFLVALYSTFDDEHPLVSRPISQIPVVRKFLVRLQHLIEIPFAFLNKQSPHIVFEEIVYHLGHFKSIGGLLWDRSGLLQLDWNGNVVAAYYSENEKVPHISDAVVFKDKLYLGAPHKQDFIAAVPVPPLLKKAFASADKQVPKPKVAPTTQQAKVDPPKPKVEKVVKEQPKAQELPKPKPTPTPKPTQAPTTPKPVEKKPVTSTTTAPKATPPPPKVQPKPAEAKPAAAKQPEPKPLTPAPNKPKAEAPTHQRKAEPKKPEIVIQKPVNVDPKPDKGKPAPQQIPIKEDIPSDTAKPSKETLKVITKGGPTEIPNPGV
ncbi:adipocyte plasma membrane-associated protein Hemomucin [Amyelois transitella]|uniref:adipocyte plasma membrane-associated protein Hemomucin n=1 Tax=Amyelois transitella TaxID=680683 RepID=UPI00298F4CEF|nr:adipocyte plasma membrane-associated protein Hemomucin [Amyelois transitella]